MRFLLIAALLLLVADSALAQKAPELGYVFPPVVRAGQTTDVQLGGYDFTPDMQFFVHELPEALEVLGPPGEFLVPGPPYWFGEKGRLTAFPIPREMPARLEIPADFPPGLIHWQVANANGSSTTAVVLVSDGSELLEQRYRETPQALEALPVAVSGRLSKIAEIDSYQFTALRSGPVTIELFARRLGADFNGIVEVRDSNDQLLTDIADTEGIDGALTFAAQANETYTIRLHDVDFRGNRAFVYRLAITPGPRVLATLPAAGQRGTTQEVTFLGYGVASGSAELETTKRTLTFPSDPQQTEWRYVLETDAGNAPAITIPLSDLPERTEAGQPVEAQLVPPCAISALMEASGKRAFTWDAHQGDIWRIEVQSQAIGGDLDPAIQVIDATGKLLANNDDLPGTADAGLDFKAPADGTFTCIVSDLSGRAGRLSSAYRLSLTPHSPSFSLSTAQQLNLPIGGTATLQIKATRFGGHNEEITIECVGLPPGVTAAGELKIPAGKSDLKLTLEAAAEAAALAAPIRILGRATSGEQSVSVTATAPAAGNLCPRDPARHLVSHVLLTTTLKPKYTVELIDKNRQRAVHRGTTYPAPFIINREEGFDGEVLLQMAARQGRHRQGIDGPIVPVPADADRIAYPCYMPEWLETDRTTRMVVIGAAKHPDPQGNLRFVTQMADARITMILEGALLKVSHRAVELSVPIGDAFQIPVDISRSAKLQTPVWIELVVPEELRDLVSTPVDRIQIDTNQSEAVLQVQTRSDPRVIGRWNLQVRATTQDHENLPVVSQTDVPVEFVKPVNASVSRVAP